MIRISFNSKKTGERHVRKKRSKSKRRRRKKKEESYVEEKMQSGLERRANPRDEIGRVQKNEKTRGGYYKTNEGKRVGKAV